MAPLRYPLLTSRIAALAFALIMGPISLRSQTLSLEGLPVSIGDSQSPTLEKLATRFVIEAIDSENYVIRDRTAKHELVGSVSFWRGFVSQVSREWYRGPAANTDRQFGLALTGAMQALGIREQGVKVLASYKELREPSGLFRIVEFSIGRHSVIVAYNEQVAGTSGVNISERIR